ncbi:DUF2169 family type VI secretion system accessory protein [Polyangium aurulentum]|uniref:DUF2169 family type VI secretion system accessory protein n=1 Tax=Polyangium aurulentum TaxID=2567896 RepID=UPI0010AEB5E3|nr:DUF2169 domain-containing protein [Polyangium aurulentum]UQA57791.1 DUF2169 domain-containing protein [Polyangium aurulentum]
MAKIAFALDGVTALPGATAAAFAWRTRGRLEVTVLVKATFAFAPDGEMRPVEPQEVLFAEVYHRGGQGRMVRFASDRAPYLPRAEVVFTGHAHAPPGAAVASMPVRITIYDGDSLVLDKALLVQDEAPFERMPIIYERAPAGPDMQENPFGVAPGSPHAPNILDPRDPSRSAGFGPIARAWPSRRRLLGDTPREALEGPIQEIPDHFNWSYFQSAPLDQQVDHLRGGEWIVLQGLHPERQQLRTRLPEARGAARVYGLSAFGVAEGQSLDLQADTLRIDGDEQRCTVVFRRSFPVPSEAAFASLRIVAGVELPGAPLAWPSHPAPPRQGVEFATLALVDDAASAPAPLEATPFRPGLAPEVLVKSADPPLIKPDTGTLALGPEATLELVSTLPLASQTLAVPPAEEELLKHRPSLPFESARSTGAAAVISMLGPERLQEHIDTGTLALPEEEEEQRQEEEPRPPEPSEPPSPEPPRAEEPRASVQEVIVTAEEPPAEPAPPVEKPRPVVISMPPAASPALKANLYKRFDRNER